MLTPTPPMASPGRLSRSPKKSPGRISKALSRASKFKWSDESKHLKEAIEHIDKTDGISTKPKGLVLQPNWFDEEPDIDPE